jgi:hypothetical protein
MEKNLKNGLVLGLVGIAIIASGWMLVKPKVTIADPANNDDKGNNAKLEEIKINPDALGKWLDRLAVFECDSCGTHYRRIDTNGAYSYGCLQFQKSTWDINVNRFKLLNVDIYSCVDQMLVARLMLEADYSAWGNWKTSVIDRGLGLPPR